MTQNLKLPPPANIVIFGASGDLARRKLVPALHSLACEELLPDRSQIVGVARSTLTNQAFRDRLFDGVRDYARLRDGVCAQWPTSEKRLTYLAGNYDDTDTYLRLGERLAEFDATKGTEGNRLFYLATPPSLYPLIIEQLGRVGLNHSPREGAWTRIIIEKPFGYDLASARQLNEQAHEVFGEDQIYRIDHYLGKETVQNILTFRFANTIFEPIWNRRYVDHVQITVSESADVAHRAGYYDQAGVLRDVFQNHLFQLLSLTTMEPPAMFEADALRDEKVKVLRAVRAKKKCVRAQYAGYRETEGVMPGSKTPTYAALEMFVDNWRWQGVPFYLRSGKSMATKTTEVTIQFKEVPHLMFPVPLDKHITPNILCLCLQPHEGIHLRFEAKEPGAGMRSRSVDMDFHYAEDFGSGALPEAYERLLLDALQGDAALFARADEIELAWGIIDPILDSWEGPNAAPLATYERGSWGPTEADDLLARHGRSWIIGCEEH